VVEVWGTGRKDYSVKTELSTVPVIRSWQEPIYYQNAYTIGAGKTVEEEISIPSGYGYMIYIFELSASANVLISLEVYTKVKETWEGFFRSSGYQCATINIPRGFPFGTLKLKMTNHSDIEIEAWVYFNGIKMQEKIVPILWEKERPYP